MDEGQWKLNAIAHARRHAHTYTHTCTQNTHALVCLQCLKDGNVAAVQSLSGTGSCRLMADFMKR
eukprot:1159496-Pelagomonas_calceolata.AAC.7